MPSLKAKTSLVTIALFYKCERFTLFPRAAGAADAVDIILARCGEVVVDNVGDAGDIEPTSSDVGRYQDLHMVALEEVECLLPLALGLVAVDRFRFEAALDEFFRKFFYPVLGAAEDEHLIKPGLSKGRVVPRVCRCPGAHARCLGQYLRQFHGSPPLCVPARAKTRR